MSEAVLIIGTYGSGKSSVGAELADIVEGPNLPYALLDLDMLGWYGTETSDSHTDSSVFLRNLRAVVSNYADVGVRYFILAGTVATMEELEDIRGSLPVRMRTVRLTLSLEEVTRRLVADPTSGRRDDLEEAGRQVAAGEGVGLEDVAVANDRPIREVANEIMAWLGWLSDEVPRAAR